MSDPLRRGSTSSSSADSFHLSISPSTGVPNGSPSQPLTPSNISSSVSRYAPILTRDPIVELEECIASTSRLITGLQNLHHSNLTSSSSTSHLFTSSQSISSWASNSTIKGLSSIDVSQGDVVDRLTAYVGNMQKRERRLDERMRELEGMMLRWEGVQFGQGMDLDWGDIWNENEDIDESPPILSLSGLPTSFTSPNIIGLPSHPSTGPLGSPSRSRNSDTFSPSLKSHHPPLGVQLIPTSSLAQHLSDLHRDPLLPTLLVLRETLHTHSSHTMAALRQVRNVKGAIQGAKERDEAEENARKGIEVWEGVRVEQGLQGVGVGERLGREMQSFEGMLRNMEEGWEMRMKVMKGLSVR